MCSRICKKGETLKVSIYVDRNVGKDMEIHVSDGLEVVDKEFKSERNNGVSGTLTYKILGKRAGVAKVRIENKKHSSLNVKRSVIVV